MAIKADESKVSNDADQATEFFSGLYTGESLTPIEEFRGLRLKGRSALEMICDCCGDGDDCCGFN